MDSWIFVVVMTLFIFGDVTARRNPLWNKEQSETQQLEAIETMLKNYQAKLLKSQNNNNVGPSVWVGSSPPFYEDNEEDYYNDAPAFASNDTHMFTEEPLKRTGQLHHHPAHRLVRSRNEPLSQEICRTNRYWKQINVTRDIYGDEVRIVHSTEYRQFAFVYECASEGDSCAGISGQLQSICEMRLGWANMLHVKQSVISNPANHHDVGPKWGYVAVPHHCGCRIYSRVNPFLV